MAVHELRLPCHGNKTPGFNVPQKMDVRVETGVVSIDNTIFLV